MPGKVKVKILSGRNLPVMDRGSLTTDAFVEIKLGNTCHKTEVARKTLNPQWNSDWFRFEVDDADLQDEPLQIRIMDYDTYSANDAIGKVYISLNPLLLPHNPDSHLQKTGKGSVMSGWIPVYDTLQGIRGEVNLIVKVELFSDVNKFRDSSCGVKFFYSTCVPFGYIAQQIHGFVEELVVNDDPEYQWIDKIRTPRASNEARHLAFLKLSGQVQRKIGLKAIEMGANAVLGYSQSFDLEGDIGVVARGTGTAVSLIRIQEMFNYSGLAENALLEDNRRSGSAQSNVRKAATNRIVALSAPETALKLDTNIKLSEALSKSFASNSPTVAPSQAAVRSAAAFDFQHLLQQEDSRVVEPKRGKIYGWKVKSKAWLSKPFRKVNKKLQHASSMVSINRSLTDLKIFSPGASFRSSTSDLQNDPTKKIRRGSGMTRLLVKSIMVTPLADPLDSISEHADTPATARKHSVHLRIDSCPNIVELPRESFSEKGESSMNVSTASISTGCASSIESDSEDNDYDEDEGTSATFPSEPETVSMVIQNVLENESKINEALASIRVGSIEMVEDEKSHTVIPTIHETHNPKPEFIKTILESGETSSCDWIEPGSTADEPEIKDSPKHSEFFHHLSEKIHSIGEHMHLLEPKEGTINHHGNHPGLLETAIATMLIEKLNIAEASAGMKPVEIPEESFTPELESSNVIHGFRDSVSEKISKIGSHIHMPHLDPHQLSQKLQKIATELHIPEMGRSKSHHHIRGHDIPSPIPDTRNRTQSISLAQLARQRPDLPDNPNTSPKPEKASFYTLDEFEGDPVTEIQLIKSDTNQAFDIDNAEKGFFLGDTSLEPNEKQSEPKTVTKTLTKSKTAQDLSSTNEDPRVTVSNPQSLNKESIFQGIKEKIHHIGEHVHIPTALDIKEKIHIIQEKIHLPHINVKSGPTSPAEKYPAHHRRFSLDGFKNRLSTVRRSLTLERPIFIRKDSEPSPERLSIDSEDTLKEKSTSKSTGSIQTVQEVCVLEMQEESKVEPSDKLKDDKEPKPDEEDAMRKDDLQARNETLPSSPSSRPFHPRTESVSGNRPAPVVGTPSSAIINITKEAAGMSLNRRSSDSDLSITPKGNSLNSGDRFNAGNMRTPVPRAPLNPENLEMLEYPFLTVSKFPAGFILHLGATVAARSVKLLERVPNPDEPESRDSWWKEIRMEIRSHAKALACNVVIGYTETSTITEDVCVLSATGTAAVVNFSYTAEYPHLDTSGSSRGRDFLGSSLEKRDLVEDVHISRLNSRRERNSESDGDTGENDRDNIGRVGSQTPPPLPTGPALVMCGICHTPFGNSMTPLKTIMSKCAICLRSKVPEILLATIELPDEIQTTGRGCLIQAHVIRYKRDLKGETNAKEISDGLPFLEYELHRQLICKLKVKGMNAIFGLKTALAVGERIMSLVATGTAVYLTALPPPAPPKIVAGNSWTDLEKLNDLQKSVNEAMERNRELFQLKVFHDSENGNRNGEKSDNEDSDDEVAELDLNFGNHETTILEVDDVQDLEVISLLTENAPPDGFHVVNIQYVPGMQDLDLIKHLQMFTQVWRAKVPPNQPNSTFSKHFQRLLQTIFFKLRTMIPCAVAGLRFLVSIPEADEMQILVTGMAYGLGEQGKINRFKKRMIAHSISRDGTRRMDDDLIFNLDEDPEPESPGNLLHTGSLRLRKKSPTRGLTKNKLIKHTVPIRDRYGVDITPLFYVPGGQIEKYLGNLNFFFIRESTSIREIGGISGFIHSFITELLAVVRSHVTALGGNAIVSFYMTELMMVDNPHKNQGQCLINVGGDVVFVSDIVDE